MDWVLLIGRYTVGALLVAGLVHYALWRWLEACFPSFVVRHRRWIVALMAVLVLSALARLGMRTLPWSGWSVVAGIALTWQLIAASVVVPLYAFKGVRAALAWLGAKRAWRGRPPVPPATMSRRAAIERVGGLGMLGVSGVVCGRGWLQGRSDIAVETVSVRLPKLPGALDGYTIVQLSDLHVGTFHRGTALSRTIELAQELRADLYVVTGDIVDIQAAYIREAADAIARLRARDGVVAVLGNHDYYVGGDLVREGMRAAGLRVLVNEWVEVAAAEGGGFVLAGLDDVAGSWGRGGAGGPDIDRALRGVAPDRATVLLAHQPHLFERAAGRIDVQLSGHTHGGQVRPGFTPTRLLYPYVAGRYELRGSTMWVNRGLGVVGPPVRVGARPELTRVVLVAG